MSDPIILKSGAELVINLASFDDGDRLLKAVIRELIAVQFDMDITGLSLSDISGKDINTLKNGLFQVAQSDAVQASLFKCLERCTYNGQRITKATFNDVGARGDYFPIAWEVIKTNIGPFFANLDLSLLIKSLVPSNGPRSESPSTNQDSSVSTSPERGTDLETPTR
jgi:hypothetical protein